MAIYVDNSATTAIDPQVKEAMLPFLNEYCGNPSSLHEPGHIANDAISTAREQVANLLGCDSEEIYFTAGGTMANNIAILGRARFVEANNLGKHLITSKIEHSAILGPAQFLGASGWKVTYLPVDEEGFVDISELRKAITKDTSIISIAWANNEIGTIQPIAELVEIAKQANIFFHSDAIQVPGKIPIDLKQVKVCALSVSGHKFYAPKGIGALFIRKGSNIMPITFGGGQEQGLFPGTESVANIVGLGKAAQLAIEDLPEQQIQLRKMQSYLTEKLSALTNIKFTGPINAEQRLPGHISVIVPGVTGETMILRCDLHGIYLSSGSACSNKVIEPSHVLKALGFPDHEALGAVRISFGKFNTQDECEEVAAKLENIFRLEEPAFKLQLGQSSS
jgi:cysteine desulfurase